MEVSALRYSGGIGLHARSPLLRLQSDERLITLIRRGSTAAFEVLVARYHARLLAFCRHLLGSREDAEDVLQDVFSAAFNAILDDDRPINVRPWLYRIARNRSLNHLRRIQAVGVDSMDIHLSEHGATTADKVHEREEFRLLVGDIHGLPETQRTALVLREMDALSYEQIAEAMETTVPSVKSLLVRARVSLAEAAQARMLTCEQVRTELGEVAEGLRRRPGALVRRHLRTCDRCSTFKSQLNETSKALTAVLPVGGFFLLRKLAILHIGHSAGAGAGAGSGASGASAAGQAAAVGSTAAAGTAAVMGTTSTGFLSASVGAIATKAVAGLAAAALVTAGAVEVEQPRSTQVRHHPAASTQVASVPPTTTAPATLPQAPLVHTTIAPRKAVPTHPHKAAAANVNAQKKTTPKATDKHAGTVAAKPSTKAKTPPPPPGRTQTQTDATVLAGSAPASTQTTATTGCPATGTTTSSTPATSSTSSSSTATTQPSSSTPSTPSTPSTDSSTTTTTTASSPDSTSTTTNQTTTTTPASTTPVSTTPVSTTPTGTSAEAAPDPAGSCTSDSSGSAAAGSALTSPSGGVAP